MIQFSKLIDFSIATKKYLEFSYFLGFFGKYWITIFFLSIRFENLAVLIMIQKN